MKKAIFIVSSITGNAYKLARPMEETLKNTGYEIEEYSALEFLKEYDRRLDENDGKTDLALTNEEKMSKNSQKLASEDDTNSLQKDTKLPSGDLYVVCFWCRRGSLDENSARVVSKLYSKKTILAGTMGASLERPYGKKVPLTIAEYASKYTNLLGVYVCQGKIDEKRTEKRRQLPPDHKHYLDEEGYKRHLESRLHPDENDIFNACQFVLNTSLKV